MSLEKIKVVIPNKNDKLSEYYLKASNILASSNISASSHILASSHISASSHKYDTLYQTEIDYFDPFYVQAVELINDYLTNNACMQDSILYDNSKLKELKNDPQLKSYLCEIREIPKALKNYVEFKETKDGDYYYIDYDIKHFIGDYYDKYEKNEQLETYEELMEIFRVMTRYETY